jgi:integrase
MSTATAKKPKRPEGIAIRHQSGCGARSGEECDCQPTYQAQAYSRRDKKTLRKTFPTLAAARSWRSEAQTLIRRGTLRGPGDTTIAEAGRALVKGIKDGSIRNRSGYPYKPSVIRDYERSLRLYVTPELGAKRLSSLSRVEVQDFADRLLATELDPSSVKNILMPLRVIYRRAFARSEVAINPTSGLELPAARGRRQRIADPAEAQALIEALLPEERALWAMALYSGLRRGELWALRWEDVDFDAGVIHVRRSWDTREGEIEPKSGAGTRRVPLASVLRTHLSKQKLRNGGRPEHRVLADAQNRLSDAKTLARKAQRRWKPAGLKPIGLHECRHTFASLMIAAGVNAKTLSTYLGHASIAITMDRYGHLMPGSEGEAAARLNAYLGERQFRDN